MAVSMPLSRDPFRPGYCTSNSHKTNRYYPEYNREMPYSYYPSVWTQSSLNYGDIWNDQSTKLNHIQSLIQESHVKYLKLEESPKKLEERKYLESLIEQYLCSAPHSMKFISKEISKTFDEHICNHLQCSPSKALSAWNALEKYASNLFCRPWRAEYKEIKLYSGFYKHNLEPFSPACQKILMLMGYNYLEPSSLVMIRDLDMGYLQQISLDCIIAVVEIQMIMQICECASPVPLSWGEIICYRKQQASDVNQASSDLVTIKCQEMRKRSMGPCCGQCVAMTPYPPYPHPVNYEYTLGPHELYPDRIDYAPTRDVPTGKLLDVDLASEESKPVPPPRRAKLKPVENKEEMFRPGTFDEHMAASVNLVKNSVNTPSSLPSKESGSGESWDYVYKTLQNKGYKKDLGERGDLLSLSTNHYEEYTCDPLPKNMNKTIPKSIVPSHPDIAESFRKLTVENMARLDDLLEKSKLLTARCNDTYEDSSEDDLIPVGSYDKSNHQKQQSASIKTFRKSNESSDTCEYRERHKSSSSSKSQELNHVSAGDRNCTLKPNTFNRWECKFCTYLNGGNTTVCKICCKSRSPGPEQTPLKSGGKECHHCTFVNSRNSIRCQVCSNDLENSPTYV